MPWAVSQGAALISLITIRLLEIDRTGAADKIAGDGKIYVPESGRIGTRETLVSLVLCYDSVTLLKPAEARRCIAARAFVGLVPLLLRDGLDRL